MLTPRRLLRAISLLLAAAAATFPLSAGTGQAGLDPAIWQRATDLSRRVLVIDVHSHDLYKPDSATWPRQVTPAMLAKGGISGLVQGFPIEPGAVEHPVDKILSDIRAAKGRMSADGHAAVALSGADFERIRQTGKPAMMLGVEYFSGPLEGRLDSLDTFYREGVRIIGLYHGGKDGILEGKGETRTISAFGLQVIEAMNRMGIVCDIDHLPRAARLEAINTSRAPVLVSHANVGAVVPDPFNLDDAAVERLAARGGLIGLTFNSEYVSRECQAQKDKIKDLAKKPRARVEELVDHIDYLKRRVGLDVVAIGSDYGGSGRLAPAGLETAEGFPLLIYHLLRRGYTEPEIALVLGGNFVRFLERVEQVARTSPPAQAEATARPVVIGQSLTLPSKIFEAPVELTVYAPPDYEKSSARYPVLIGFMTKFAAVAGIVDGLAGHSIPPMIVVSVDLNPAFFSLYANDGQPGSGQADRIIGFLREELGPYLDSRYRTQPFRIGFGSSSSALFCLYALFAAPDVFQAAIAAGPMFAEFDYGRVSGMMDKALDSRPARDQYFFYTRGDQPELDRDFASFQGMIKRKYAAGKTWLHGDYNPEPGESHASLPYKTLHDGLRSLFAGWANVPERIAEEGVAGLRAYRERLNGFWGCDLGVGSTALQAVRIKLTREKRFDDLIAILKSVGEDQPEDYRADQVLAMALEQAGRWTEAVSAYESALVKAKTFLRPEDLPRAIAFLQGRLERARKLGQAVRPIK